MLSSKKGHVDVVRALLQHGADVNVTNHYVRERERERERARETQRGSEIKSARARERGRLT
jgi:hypothetical protein